MRARLCHATCRTALAIALLLLASTGVARAQDGFTGRWKAGATATNVVIDSWGPDCGPRPSSSRSGGGGTVRIEQKGDLLTIVGKQRMIRSNECWSVNPAMRVASSARRGDRWTTRCRTPPNDPREESGTYTLDALTPDRLLYQDLSRFNWQLKRSRCTASITTVQTLVREGAGRAPSLPALPAEVQAKRPGRAAPRAPAPPPPPQTAAASAKPACTPGEPARLTLRPLSAQLELGGRACFRARVSDAAGCTLAGAAVRWELQAPPGLRGELEGGCFQAGKRAAEAEGRFLVRARVGKHAAEAAVTVEAVDLSALLARRLGAGALTGELEAPPPTSTPPPAKPTAASATRTVPRSRADGSGTAWVLSGAALVLGLLLLLVLRRRARIPVLPPETAGPAPDAAATPATAPPTDPRGYVCPTCRQGFAQPGRCPKDDTSLIPYAEFSARGQAPAAPTKRCPSCGTVYPADTAFCGADGTRLDSNATAT